MSQNILIVEDNPITRKMIKLTLNLEGYKIHEADTVKSALEIVNNSEINLIIMDFKLPDGSGLDCAKSIKKIDNLNNVPILALSGLISSSDTDEYNDIFQEIIAKPIEPNQLISIVKKYLLPKFENKNIKKNNIKVLIVDDDTYQLKISTILLNNNGFETISAPNGKEAIDLVHKHKPDIIVTDVLMPIIDGFRLCMKINEDPTTSHIPVIILSSYYLEEKDIDFAKEIGAYSMISKENFNEKLIPEINKALDYNSTIHKNIVSSHKKENYLESYVHRLLHQLENQVKINQNISKKLNYQSASLLFLNTISESFTNEKEILEKFPQVFSQCIDAAGILIGAIFIFDEELNTTKLMTQVGFDNAESQILEDLFNDHEISKIIKQIKEITHINENHFPQEWCLKIFKLAPFNKISLVPITSASIKLGIMLLSYDDNENFSNLSSSFMLPLATDMGLIINLSKNIYKLQASEEKNRNYIEKANDVVLVYRPDGQIIESNLKAQEIFLSSETEIKTKNIFSIISSDDLERFKSNINKLISEEYSLTKEVHFELENKHEIYIDFSSSLIKNGENLSIFSIGRDVTLQKSLNSLLEREKSLSLLQENIIIKSNSSPDVNSAMYNCLEIICKFLDWPLAQIYLLSKKNNNEIIPLNISFLKNIDKNNLKKYLNINEEIIKKLSFTTKPLFFENITNNNKSISYSKEIEQYITSYLCLPIILDETTIYYFEFYSDCKKNIDNHTLKMMYFIGLQVGHIISRFLVLEEREKLLAETYQSSQAKTQFLATMSHELRTPLHAIKSSTDLLLTTNLSSEQTDYLETTNRSLLILTEIINDIFDLQSINLGKISVSYNRFNLSEVIHNKFTKFALMAKEKGLSFKTNFDENIPKYFVGDEKKIKQILTHLLSNAIKFTKQGGIEVTVKKITNSTNKNIIQITIIDTGIGIDNKHHEHIFDEFYQIDNSLKRKFGGSGIGLTICQKLIKLMNDEIKFESVLNQGSTFSIIIHDKQDELNEPNNDNIQTINNTQLNINPKNKILIVDDDKVNQLVAQKMLEKLDFNSDLANNGSEAIEYFKKNSYSLILMDYHMPEMNGLESIQKIREIENSNHSQSLTPIIIVTGDYNINLKDESIKFGANDLVTKPMGLQILTKIIDNWIFNKNNNIRLSI